MNPIIPELSVFYSKEEDGDVWVTSCHIEDVCKEKVGGWSKYDLSFDFGTMAPTEQMARDTFFKLLAHIRAALDAIQELPEAQ